MAILTLAETDNNKSFQLNRGDEIVIHLKENPTTGFRWAIDQTDDTILSLQSPNFAPSPGSSTATPASPTTGSGSPTIAPASPVSPLGRPIGAGGTRTFTFIANQPGTAHLQLKLWREWEGDSSIRQRFKVTIRIQH